MKKVLTIGLLVLALASCKKDYTCECTIAGVTVPTEIKDAKKADAEATCNTADVDAKLLGGSCTLK
jgi:hypothetical protein